MFVADAAAAVKELQIQLGSNGGQVNFDDVRLIHNAVVPLPAAVWLFASGLGLLGWLGRRRAVASRDVR